ncbi:hypothetical protein MHUMG1_09698 [Metarhizium humberi]|uniref:Uncharacterized protein n=1 Tax=Metarhizium humberi TaxID=2596975 RepID=A0A9P8S3C0_9HYPO|nr:hypothetical protein MHUMG1_09698 [Metarhizium humberi]
MRFTIDSTLITAALALSAAQTGLAAPVPQTNGAGNLLSGIPLVGNLLGPLLSGIPLVGGLLGGGGGSAGAGAGAGSALSGIPIVGGLLGGGGGGAGAGLGSLGGLLGRDGNAIPREENSASS